MSIDRNRIFEYLGHIAIVLSLLFVALEIRQSNRIAIGTTSYEIQRNYMTFNDLVMSDEALSNLIVKLLTLNTNTELSPSESIRAAALARRFLNMWVAIQVAYDNGLIEEAVYMGGVEDVMDVAGNVPGLMPYFRENLSARNYNAEHQILKPLVEGIGD